MIESYHNYWCKVLITQRHGVVSHTYGYFVKYLECLLTPPWTHQSIPTLARGPLSVSVIIGESYAWLACQTSGIFVYDNGIKTFPAGRWSWVFSNWLWPFGKTVPHENCLHLEQKWPQLRCRSRKKKKILEYLMCDCWFLQKSAKYV